MALRMRVRNEPHRKYFREPALNYMRTDFQTLDMCMTVDESLARILERGAEGRIDYFYVVDETRRLAGVIPTRRLLTSPRDRRLVEIMIPRVIALPRTATVFDALELFALHRFLALPIVDEERRIIGIVDINIFTDEFVDWGGSREEVNAVFETIGYHISEIRNASPFKAFQLRFPWLLATIASGTICAFIADGFEGTLAQSIILAFFLTLLLGLGESVGIQSMSVAIHMLTAAHPTVKWYLRELRREIFAATLLGLGCGALVMIIVLGWWAVSPVVLAIGLSVFFIIVIACIIGLSVPAVLHGLKLDPKIAAGPITLGLADIFTLLIYFGIAWFIL